MNAPLLSVVGDVDDDNRARLEQLIRRAETLGDFPRPSLVDKPAWLVVVGWGRGDGPVTLSRYNAPLRFTAPTVDGVTQQLEGWIVEQDS
ncbi:MAG: hypothetical protein GVY35_16020 [Bacteroidetes bacterium]|jgi:hypothetical protein|nr:hypothetical protein [Bacteroidota bacterium]